MQKRTSIRQSTRSVILAILIAVSSTAISAQSGSGSVSTIPTTRSADECTQMLDKALSEVEASRKAIAALTDANDAYKRLDAANAALLAAKDTIIAAQEKRYDRLAQTKCSKTSFLFGLISKKTCF